MMFKSNMEENDTMDKNHGCIRCGKRYKLLSSLQRHLKYECGVEPSFRCPFCIFKAKQKVTLKKHLAARHDEKMEYIIVVSDTN